MESTRRQPIEDYNLSFQNFYQEFSFHFIFLPELFLRGPVQVKIMIICFSNAELDTLFGVS